MRREHGWLDDRITSEHMDAERLSVLGFAACSLWRHRMAGSVPISQITSLLLIQLTLI